MAYCRIQSFQGDPVNKFEVPTNIQKLHDALTADRVEYNKAEKRVLTSYKKWHDKYSKWVMEQFTAVDDKLAFIFHPEFGDTTGQDYYKASLKYINDRYGHAVMMSGINGITRQRCIKLLFHRDNVENHKMIRQVIDETLPYIVPFTADMEDYRDRALDPEMIGYCYYDIMEHSLSENGNYDVLVSPTDKKIVVVSNRYGSRKYSEPMDYDKGLAYLAKNLYYESSDSEDDDED